MVGWKSSIFRVLLSSKLRIKKLFSSLSHSLAENKSRVLHHRGNPHGAFENLRVAIFLIRKQHFDNVLNSRRRPIPMKSELIIVWFQGEIFGLFWKIQHDGTKRTLEKFTISYRRQHYNWIRDTQKRAAKFFFSKLDGNLLTLSASAWAVPVSCTAGIRILKCAEKCSIYINADRECFLMMKSFSPYSALTGSASFEFKVSKGYLISLSCSLDYDSRWGSISKTTLLCYFFFFLRFINFTAALKLPRQSPSALRKEPAFDQLI